MEDEEKRPFIIISATDDTVEQEVLEWAGLWGLWEDNEPTLSNFNIVADVLSRCPSASVEEDEWDGDFPGRSGVTYQIATSDPGVLKRELKAVLEAIIRNPNKDSRPQDKQQDELHLPRTASEIADYLDSEATEVSKIRTSPGGPLARATARLMRVAANEIRSGDGSAGEIKRVILRLVNALHWDSSRRSKCLRIVAATEKPGDSNA